MESAASLEIDAKKTALVLIDLQQRILVRGLAPYSGAEVCEKSSALATALRAKGGTVIYVQVNINEFHRLPVDAEAPKDPTPLPPSSAELAPEAGRQPGDPLITKRQWGAFYGTNLEQELRRRGITTIIMGGVATNYGVESTARAAFDRAYQLIFAEDAMTSRSVELHEFPVKHIFPRMGRVRSTEQILAAL